jgi:hypothetical protein
MSDVTRILSQIEQGDHAAEELLPLVYDELRKLAATKLSQDKPGRTLQATALSFVIALQSALDLSHDHVDLIWLQKSRLFFQSRPPRANNSPFASSLAGLVHFSKDLFDRVFPVV